MPRCPALVPFALSLLALSAAADCRALEHYEGLAYDSKTGRLLYMESHWIKVDRRLVLYRCASGEPFARKLVVGATAAPDFELVDGRDGYREGVRSRAGIREVYSRASADAPERRKSLPAEGDQVIDAGFDAYVRQRWDALAETQDKRIAFVIPSRLQSMDFVLSPLPSSAGSRRFGLALGAWYGGLLPGITVTYANDRRLVRFEGIGNIRTAAGKYPSVRIEFPRDRRGVATAAELAVATRMPLVRSCPRA
ncbi:MAG: hypothetical protein EON92_01850 [Burkholderiales bacterium]|nr:MAG: hypothetical protein EON92_01850 [Burkholderiales bacterium]